MVGSEVYRDLDVTNVMGCGFDALSAECLLTLLVSSRQAE